MYDVDFPKKNVKGIYMEAEQLLFWKREPISSTKCFA